MDPYLTRSTRVLDVDRGDPIFVFADVFDHDELVDGLLPCLVHVELGAAVHGALDLQRLQVFAAALDLVLVLEALAAEAGPEEAHEEAADLPDGDHQLRLLTSFFCCSESDANELRSRAKNRFSI